MPVKYNKKVAFTSKLAEYIENHTSGNLIIGGNLNWVGDEIDRKGKLTPNYIIIKDQMEYTIKSLKLIDIYRQLNISRQ